MQNKGPLVKTTPANPPLAATPEVFLKKIGNNLRTYIFQSATQYAIRDALPQDAPNPPYVDTGKTGGANQTGYYLLLLAGW